MIAIQIEGRCDCLGVGVTAAASFSRQAHPENACARSVLRKNEPKRLR